MKVGRTLFWLSSVFAALIVLWVVSDFFYGLSNDYPPTVNIVGTTLAAAIWAAGWLCRFAL